MIEKILNPFPLATAADDYISKKLGNENTFRKNAFFKKSTLEKIEVGLLKY